jgi:hypothetical protein
MNKPLHKEKIMKNLIIVATILLFAAAAWAGSGTTRRYGNTEYHTFDNGVTGTTRQYGNTKYHNFSDGTTGTTRKYGGTEYHTFQEPQQNKSRQYTPPKSMMEHINKDGQFDVMKSPWD